MCCATGPRIWMCNALPLRSQMPRHEANLPGTDVGIIVSKSRRRFYRTTVLGILAMAALVWAAVDQFGITREEIGELFLGVVVVVGLVIAAAALVVFLWIGLRRLFTGG